MNAPGFPGFKPQASAVRFGFANFNEPRYVAVENPRTKWRQQNRPLPLPVYRVPEGLRQAPGCAVESARTFKRENE